MFLTLQTKSPFQTIHHDRQLRHTETYVGKSNALITAAETKRKGPRGGGGGLTWAREGEG